VIASTPLLFRLVVTCNCHLLSAHGVVRFLHYYADSAVMNTVKVDYSVPDDELVISGPLRKTGSSKKQSLPPTGSAFRHHSNENAFWSCL